MMVRSPALLVFTLITGTLALAVVGLCVGSTGLENIYTYWWSPVTSVDHASMARQIIWEIRLPRTVGAWAAGALLGLAGALAQGLFRNPLADPFLLGSASGASLGVAIALVVLGGGTSMLGSSSMMSSELSVNIFSSNLWVRLGLTGAAFMGAILAVFLTLLLSRGVGHTLRLLLSGVIVGVVLGAATHLVLLFSPDLLQAMQSFILGSTVFVGWNSAMLMVVVWSICCVAVWLLGRVLDGLSLGDATAFTLGLPVAPMRLALVLVMALATGTAVAQTGLIAFVGLAAPHLVRSLIKTTLANLMLLASLAGGLLLLAADILARGLIAPQELPVGVLTAVLGGGYLLWLMHARSARGVGSV